ncbi:MAG: deoxynucleoside kinase [Candidatus Marinimicrobia bacterium]|nr:deoxynucleoside kinase [Candidatus Neomarinimicrobiota bacterium]
MTKHKHPFVGIAGNIGVGKTTFTKIIAERLNWTPYYESVADNPYLSDFYGNMKRWSFNLQIYFLHHRFRMQAKIAHDESGAIQDRTIYEDVEIFAKNLHLLGNMDERDWQNYQHLFELMTSYLRTPDLIIYLKASTDTLITRIKGRDRDFEKSIDPEYLHQLNISYDRWVDSLSDIPVQIIDTNHFNIYQDKKELDDIIIDIVSNLSGFDINK